MIATHEESWMAVVRHARKEIKSARDGLETPNLPQGEADFLRGQIAALRRLLALGEADTAWTPLPKSDYMSI